MTPAGRKHRGKVPCRIPLHQRSALLWRL